MASLDASKLYDDPENFLIVYLNVLVFRSGLSHFKDESENSESDLDFSDSESECSSDGVPINPPRHTHH